MQLDTEWTLGLNSVAYGLVELEEIEAGTAASRGSYRVQSSLCGHAIHAFGSEEQKNEWLPEMAVAVPIACFGLSEPDSGSDPGSMRTSAKKDGDDLVAQRHQECDDERKLLRHRDRVGADRRRRPRLHRPDRLAGLHRERHPQEDVAPRLGNV